MSGGGVETGGDTESEAAPGSELSAQSPIWDSNPQTVKSSELKSDAYRLSHPGAPKICFFFFLIFFSTFIYFWDRERQSMSGGGAEREREGHTESEAAPGSELSAQSPTRGSNS